MRTEEGIARVQRIEETFFFLNEARRKGWEERS